jgi:hypothetical protein
MPLLPGKQNVGHNIEELQQPSAHAPHGRPRRQAIAIALEELRRQGHHVPRKGAYTEAYENRRRGG